jgi:hypothetical protein
MFVAYCFFENPHVQQLFLQALTAGSIPRHDTAKVEEYMAQYLDKPTPKIKKKRRTGSHFNYQYRYPGLG